MASDLALTHDADRWVGALALIIAGTALLLADLSRADDVRWRLAQIVVAGGCIASGLASAVGAG